MASNAAPSRKAKKLANRERQEHAELEKKLANFPAELRPFYAADLRERQLKALESSALVCVLFCLDADSCWPYVLSAGVLRRSAVAQVGEGTGLRFVMLVPEPGRLALTEEMAAVLEQQGWELRPVPYDAAFESKTNKCIAEGHHYRHTMGMKIHAFGLGTRALYVDVDSFFADPRSNPLCALGELGCFAELLRLPMGGRLAAAPYDAQKGLFLRGEPAWRKRHSNLVLVEGGESRVVSALHWQPIPAALTRFDYEDMRGDPNRRRPSYRMMLTGIMAIAPVAGLQDRLRRHVLASATDMYSDGDMLTHAVTMAGLEDGQDGGWLGMDALFGVYRGAAAAPYGTQFGVTPPWRAEESWPSGRAWREHLACLLQEKPGLVPAYQRARWCGPRGGLNMDSLTAASGD